MSASRKVLRVKTKHNSEVRRFAVPRAPLSFDDFLTEIRRIHKLQQNQGISVHRWKSEELLTSDAFTQLLSSEVPQIAVQVKKIHQEASQAREEKEDACDQGKQASFSCVKAARSALKPGPQSTNLKDGTLPPVTKSAKYVRYTSSQNADQDDAWLADDEESDIKRLDAAKEVKLPPKLANRFKKSITIFVNGEKRIIKDFPPDQLLGFYLRTNRVTSTKLGCYEGGCGCCTVVLSFRDPDTGELVHTSTNSCMRLLASCDGMQITTASGVGNEFDGFSQLQRRLAEDGGTQCGYCTAGWVTQMFSLLLNDRRPDMQTIEDNFSGNLCRCTGYRPILTAFHTFAKDVASGKEKWDEEESCNLVSSRIKDVAPARRGVFLQKDGVFFVRPTKFEEIFVFLRLFEGRPLHLVVGNTSRGVVKYYDPHPNDNPVAYIDVSAISELRQMEPQRGGLVVGAAVKITELQQLLRDNIRRSSTFTGLADHIELIAGHQVRNTSSWAGNLMIAQTHPAFPSDLLTLFSTIGAKLTISTILGDTQVSMVDFMRIGVPCSGVIKNIFIPFDDQTVRFSSFKIRARVQDSHPIVNAGYRLKVERERITEATIVYGGIIVGPFFAERTQHFLIGRPLTPDTLQGALRSLSQEVRPVEVDLFTIRYRKTLTETLFYKFFLSLQDNLDPRLVSAAMPPKREISTGRQVLVEGDRAPPVGQPIPLLTGMIQTAGDAVYTVDNPNPTEGVYASPVTATQAGAPIISIDATEALGLPGVIDFITAADVEDIGGNNNVSLGQELFATKTTKFFGEFIGMLIAESQAIADNAVPFVRVEYGEPERPLIFTIQDGIKHQSFFPMNIPPVTKGDVDKALQEADHVVEGRMFMGSQLPFYMECQSALATPEEDGTINVKCASQAPADVRDTLINVLGIPGNLITVDVKRCGGGFGGKGSTATRFAPAVAVCARKLRRPVRCQLERVHDMHYVSRRNPFLNRYRAGYNDDGHIVAVDMNTFSDGGFNVSGLGFIDFMAFQGNAENAYNFENFRSVMTGVKTDLPENAPVRSPGNPNAIMAIENIIDHVARDSGMDPAVLREMHFYKNGDTTPQGQPIFASTLGRVWERLKRMSRFQELQAEVEKFNKENRWRKRGIAMTPVKYSMSTVGKAESILINISAMDGTVRVSTSGVEIGQGLFTKVAQAVSFGLGVSIDKIHVSATSTRYTPNFTGTFGSSTSESCVQAALHGCENMRKILKPFRDENPDASWEELVMIASQQASLSATGFFVGDPNGRGAPYWIWTAGVTVAEIDVLTGEQNLIEGDIVYDAGQPLNPFVDLGQVEGSYVMGIGLALTESVVNANPDGSLKTPGTWEYKPPCSKSIPEKLNIGFLDKARNPVGILSSKATGEPAVDLAAGVILAVKDAIAAAREESGDTFNFELNSPCTVQETQLSSLVSLGQLTF